MKLTRERVAYIREDKAQPDGEAARLYYRRATSKEWIEFQGQLAGLSGEEEGIGQTMGTLCLAWGRKIAIRIENLNIDGEDATLDDAFDLFPGHFADIAQINLMLNGGTRLDMGESERRLESSPPSDSAPESEVDAES